MQTLKRNKVMKLCSYKVSLLLEVIMSILLTSCKDDAPYFTRSNYGVDCFLDADEEYSLEDAVGRTLDASCSISNENEGVAELQVDQETGKHIIIAKKIGRTRINLVRGEEHVSVTILVKTQAIDFWRITDRIEKIDCASDLKEIICADMYESQVLPKLQVNDDVYFGYGSKGRWNMSYSSNRDDLIDFYVDYAKGDTEYKFYAWLDMDKKQAFTFSLDEVRRPSGEDPTKYGTFTCDLTDYYQQKYGQDKVRRVVLSYKVVSFRMII